jgi:hypothetical protein
MKTSKLQPLQYFLNFILFYASSPQTRLKATLVKWLQKEND